MSHIQDFIYLPEIVRTLLGQSVHLEHMLLTYLQMVTYICLTKLWGEELKTKQLHLRKFPETFKLEPRNAALKQVSNLPCKGVYRRDRIKAL